jgi:hypothetical protein
VELLPAAPSPEIASKPANKDLSAILIIIIGRFAALDVG